MASYTTNLNLRKIDGTDAPPDITVLNQNWDILDQTIENKMNKHLLQYDGDIKENGVRLTFPVLYNMLLNKPEFVVLVNDGEALHPNVVNNEKIVFVSVDPDNTGLSGRKVTMTNDGYSTVTLEENTSVPSTRKVNNKALSSDVSLTATDVGALPISGGTLTEGVIKFSNGSGRIWSQDTWIQLDAFGSINDENNRNSIIINAGATVPLSTVVRCQVKSNGGTNQYNMYGEHNKSLLSEAEKTLPNTNIRYYKDADSTVHVYGTTTVSGSSNAWITIGNMPVGYRPSTDVVYSARGTYTVLNGELKANGSINVASGTQMTNLQVAINLSYKATQ